MTFIKKIEKIYTQEGRASAIKELKKSYKPSSYNYDWGWGCIYLLEYKKNFKNEDWEECILAFERSLKKCNDNSKIDIALDLCEAVLKDPDFYKKNIENILENILKILNQYKESIKNENIITRLEYNQLLGYLYYRRISGKKEENLKNAKKCAENALSVLENEHEENSEEIVKNRAALKNLYGLICKEEGNHIEAYKSHYEAMQLYQLVLKSKNNNYNYRLLGSEIALLNTLNKDDDLTKLGEKLIKRLKSSNIFNNISKYLSLIDIYDKLNNYQAVKENIRKLKNELTKDKGNNKQLIDLYCTYKKAAVSIKDYIKNNNNYNLKKILKDFEGIIKQLEHFQNNNINTYLGTYNFLIKNIDVYIYAIRTCLLLYESVNKKEEKNKYAWKLFKYCNHIKIRSLMDNKNLECFKLTKASLKNLETNIDKNGIKSLKLLMNKVFTNEELTEELNKLKFSEINKNLILKFTRISCTNLNLKSDILKKEWFKSNISIIDYFYYNEPNNKLENLPLIIFVITKKSKLNFVLIYEIAKIMDTLEEYKQAIKKNNATNLDNISKKLYTLFFKKIEEYLPKAEYLKITKKSDEKIQLLISPYGALADIPFAILQYSENKYLIDIYDICYLPSIYILYKKTVCTSDDRLLYIGMSNYSPISGVSILIPESSIASALSNSTTFPFKVSHYRNEKVDIDLFYRVRKSKYILYVGHGDVSKKNLELVLTTGERISALDFLKIDFCECRLIMLAACHTGLMGQYLESMVYGFIRKNVTFIIAPLWDLYLNDENFKKFITEFFKELLSNKNKNVITIFNQVQRNLKNSSKLLYYWGSFVLCGFEIT